MRPGHPLIVHDRGGGHGLERIASASAAVAGSEGQVRRNETSQLKANTSSSGVDGRSSHASYTPQPSQQNANTSLGTLYTAV